MLHVCLMACPGGLKVAPKLAPSRLKVAPKLAPSRLKVAPKLAPSRLKVAPRLAIASICSWSSCLNLQRPGVRGVGLVNTSMQHISQKFDSLSLAMVLACSHFSCCGYCLKYWKSAIYTLRALATWLCSHVNQAQGTTAC